MRRLSTRVELGLGQGAPLADLALVKRSTETARGRQVSRVKK